MVDSWIESQEKSERQLLKMIETAYRLGLRHAKDVDDISPYLITSQVTAYDIYFNKL